MSKNKLLRGRMRQTRLLASVLASSQLFAVSAFAQLTPVPPGSPASDSQKSITPGAPLSNTPAPAVPPPTGWTSTIKLTASAEAGIIANVDRPADGLNFGHLYTDKANQAQLNQILLTATRPVDSSSTNFDIGFNLQALYGSDARFNHVLGLFPYLTGDRYQFVLLQANVVTHIPWAGISTDAKLGIFPGPQGLETTDPTTTPFYTHSYIFNYAVTFIHTGLLTTTHLNPILDFWLGVDTGNQTTFGGGDNNGEPAGTFGFGLNNLAGGKLTVLALSHVGPEDAVRALGPIANRKFRYYNDVLVTYKANDKLTLSTEFNYLRDDGLKAEAWGVAGYAGYALNDNVILNARAEVYRDSENAFVATNRGNLDPVRALAGYSANFATAPAPTTYGALTLGVTFKPSLPVKGVTVLVRPEIRYDRSLNGTTPFNAQRDVGSFLFGGDIVVGF
jgi:hypothetical protein